MDSEVGLSRVGCVGMLGDSDDRHLRGFLQPAEVGARSLSATICDRDRKLWFRLGWTQQAPEQKS